MKNPSQGFTILMADDDPDDYFLVKDAMDGDSLKGQLFLVTDGEELMDYLHKRGKYGNGQVLPKPTIILLDLNMPRKDGREVIRELKSDAAFRTIPIIVFTTSANPEDIRYCYESGVNSYIKKPSDFQALNEIVKNIWEYWLETVQLDLN